MEFGGEELDESAKWRDPKYKDQLYTQEKPDYNDSREYDNAMWYPKPKGYKGRKEPMAGGEFPRTDPLVKGFGRYGVGEPVSKGPRKGLPSRDQITSLKGSIKDAHGKHHKPNLPEQGVAEGSLEEIDRRGFLRGMGAAAVAGAAGGAKATQDIGKEGQQKVMDMMGLWYACQNYTKTKYTVPPDICQNAKQSINKFIRNFPGGKEYLNSWYATMHDFEKQEIAKGKLSTFTSNVVSDPNYAKQVIRNFDSLSAFDESVQQGVAEGKPREKEADYGADYQDMVARVKKLAGMGPLKTVYDPQKRVYRNVPTAVQPPKK
jgi:hypothetical protein